MRNRCIDHGCKGYGLGYATAWLRKDGEHFTTTKHRKVHYEATGEWPPVVRHKCDNARCINADHLEGGTAAQNNGDMMERGRCNPNPQYAGRNGNYKHPYETIMYIRSKYVPGCRVNGGMALSRETGVSRTQIARILEEKHRASS